MNLSLLSIAAASFVSLSKNNAGNDMIEEKISCGFRPQVDVSQKMWPHQVAPPKRAYDLCLMESLTAPRIKSWKSQGKVFLRDSLEDWTSLATAEFVSYVLKQKSLAVGFTIAAASQSIVRKAGAQFLFSPVEIEQQRVSELRGAFDVFRESKNASFTAFSGVNRQIKRMDLSIQRSLAAGDTDAAKNLLFHRQAVLANWPFFIQLPSISQKQNTLETNEKIQRILSPYSLETKIALETMIGKMVMAGHPEFAPQSKNQVMFVGPPGVGKSFVLEQLAETLGLPVFFAKISRSNFFQNGILELLGESFDRLTAHSRWKEVPSSTCEMVGWFACGLFSTQVLNPIIAFDEASSALNDPALVATLKRILDPKYVTMPIIPFGGVELDLSRVTFVFLGNEPVADPAIRSRLDIIAFPLMEIQKKREILEDEARKQVERAIKTVDGRTEIVTELVKQAIPLMMALEEEYKVPGMRLLLSSLEKVVSFVCARDFERRKASVDEIKMLLKMHYEKNKNFEVF